MNPKDLHLLQERLSYTFNTATLLQQALTHKSYINETKEEKTQDNERLEFLGDAVLDLIICETLMERFPDAPEGELSKMKAKIVNEETLAQIATQIDLGSFLFLGKGEERTQGKGKPSLLANAMEALIAALYLDGGLAAAKKTVLDQFDMPLKTLVPGEIFFDYKTALQEYSQKTFGTLPVYKVANESGPDHQKQFEIEVYVDEKPCGIGIGTNKKTAEQISAEKALATLKEKKNGR